MQFKVTGIDGTGQEKAYTVKAESEQEALAIIRKKGVFATGIVPEKPSTASVQVPAKSTPPAVPSPPVSPPAPVAEAVPPPSPALRQRWEYKMVQIPPNIQVAEARHKGNEAAAYLAAVVDREARDGWEFYRVDEIGVQINPGCLGALFGAQVQHVSYFVVTFRREVGTG